jgi:hypothetical protein
MSRLSVAALVVLSCAACTQEASPPIWDELDRNERILFMNDTVMPVMRDIFQAHDSTAYAAFGCQTCHGDDMLEVDYRMPNTLMPLPLDGTLEAAQARDLEATQFMLDDVFPVMTELLGRERYNPDTAPDGFRCVGCHRVDDG